MANHTSIHATNSYRFPYKCMGCGLHFNVYSWNEDWNVIKFPTGKKAQRRAHCPECGSRATFSLGVEALDTEIYEHVSAVTNVSA